MAVPKGHSWSVPSRIAHNGEAKQCTKCNQTKPLSEFGKRKDRAGGVRSMCILCGREANKAYHAKNAERLSENKRIGRKNNPEMWFSYKKSKYGITFEQYNEMLARQNGVCAICHKQETRVYKNTICSLAIDHCHTTGKVRGLLCTRCNSMLGHALDDVSILESAKGYLNEHQ